MMRSPWLHYEAYDIKVVNNVFHDIPGVPLSVAGGYNVLFAHNTLVRVATSPTGYPLFQVVHGERNCTPTDELPNPVPACKAKQAEGGWGPGQRTDGAPVIPSRNVWLYNNLFYNPGPGKTAYTHFQVAQPAALPAGFKNLPASVAVDQGLVIAGNVVWNGPKTHPLGFEEPDSGCQSAHPTCSRARVMEQNAINTFEPQLLNVAQGDFHPKPGAFGGARLAVIPPFVWTEAPSPAVPPGNLLNVVRSSGVCGAF